jgi:hypothetical protein
MALVADVATDAVSGRVLEAAVGRPQKILVLVKDLCGGTRLTIGYIYSWYEFPSEKRWTDTEWRDTLYTLEKPKEGQAIPPPAWYDKFHKY